MSNLQVPETVAEWVEDMCSSWDFQCIIPCHMAAPIQARPDDLRCAHSSDPFSLPWCICCLYMLAQTIFGFVLWFCSFAMHSLCVPAQ